MAKSKEQKNHAPKDLGRRERQIMELVYQLEEASVAQVREAMPDPPSYSSVRTCLLYTSPSPRDATLSRMPSSA